ncbi:hypothetical protein COT97_03240 [Candidatus Falkowbacteria bacterium CG10_big_fil_rev_8_21_14_0_10_39_11]|uniref:DUF2059 domain-containing protein n=1 Tax=Candidatus Falkowbacteria bacterium CG10_big_fil_rev_8_21_14_0_10_39_11 TaxID=1974565 RepID=A0A2H0V4Q5_9BACT|nr:MAG: hypothetical protein COT97_03240 [Candidatus Falkowbacteria bacterium CG10_big_fil_rev_8_21_14_0_10_39_11]
MATLALVQEYFDAIGVKGQIHQISKDWVDTTALIESTFKESAPDDELYQRFESVVNDRVNVIVLDYMRRLMHSIVESMLPFFAECLTDEEMQQIIDWSKSEVAQKFVALQPQMTPVFQQGIMTFFAANKAAMDEEIDAAMDQAADEVGLNKEHLSPQRLSWGATD